MASTKSSKACCWQADHSPSYGKTSYIMTQQMSLATSCWMPCSVHWCSWAMQMLACPCTGVPLYWKVRQVSRWPSVPRICPCPQKAPLFLAMTFSKNSSRKGTHEKRWPRLRQPGPHPVVTVCRTAPTADRRVFSEALAKTPRGLLPRNRTRTSVSAPKLVTSQSEHREFRKPRTSRVEKDSARC